MIKYIVKRLFYAILTLLCLSCFNLFMMRLLPGDPFIGEKAIPETTLKALNEKYGLDKPMMTVYNVSEKYIPRRFWYLNGK